jgi:hypothetical protein
MTFGPAEATLNDWMAEHARVVWMTCDEPWLVEDKLIEDLSRRSTSRAMRETISTRRSEV